jgi:NADH:ubiquinone oxidoreductase subunit 4 (subunit M)
MFYFGAMMIGLIWMGMYPQSFLDMSSTTLTNLLNETGQLLFTQGSEL